MTMPRLTYANVVSTICLLLLLTTGTAWAARQLTGQDILNNSLTGADVKARSIPGTDLTNNSVTGTQVRNGSIGEAELTAAVKAKLGATGAAGATGPAGPAGATGATGPRGVSAWDTIPSGQTVIGSFARRQPGPVNGGSGHINVDLPGIAPVALTSATINTDQGDDADAACTGTVFAPTAPAGKVCIYLSFMFGASAIDGFEHPYLTSRAFRIRFTMAPYASTNQFHLDGTWAYTAP